MKTAGLDVRIQELRGYALAYSKLQQRKARMLTKMDI